MRVHVGPRGHVGQRTHLGAPRACRSEARVSAASARISAAPA
jgi:hypothetical protein